jgi:hypothetical protein
MAAKIAAAAEAIYAFSHSLGELATQAAGTKEDVATGAALVVGAVEGSSIQLSVGAAAEALTSRMTVVASILDTAKKLQSRVSALSTDMEDQSGKVVPLVASIHPSTEEYQMAEPALEILTATEGYFGSVT